MAVLVGRIVVHTSYIEIINVLLSEALSYATKMQQEKKLSISF